MAPPWTTSTPPRASGSQVASPTPPRGLAARTTGCSASSRTGWSWRTRTPRRAAPWGLDRLRRAPASPRPHLHLRDDRVERHRLRPRHRDPRLARDFGGRVAGGYATCPTDGGRRTATGHGTHVAGTLGRQHWGVAKAVRLVPVRVLDCDGLRLDVGHHRRTGLGDRQRQEARPSPTSASAGGEPGARRRGAAGPSPRRHRGRRRRERARRRVREEPGRVAGRSRWPPPTTRDTQAPYSNHGTCVDLYAPGRGSPRPGTPPTSPPPR
jgi:hypothetical protein